MKPIRKRVVLLAGAAVVTLAGAELGRDSPGSAPAQAGMPAHLGTAEPNAVSAEPYARLHGFANADWVKAFSTGWH